MKLFSCIDVRARFGLNDNMSLADWKEMQQMENGANDMKLKIVSAGLQTIIILPLCFLSAGRPLHCSLSQWVIFFFFCSHVYLLSQSFIQLYLWCYQCLPFWNMFSPSIQRIDVRISFFFFFFLQSPALKMLALWKTQVGIQYKSYISW